MSRRDTGACWNGLALMCCVLQRAQPKSIGRCRKVRWDGNLVKLGNIFNSMYIGIVENDLGNLSF